MSELDPVALEATNLRRQSSKEASEALKAQSVDNLPASAAGASSAAGGSKHLRPATSTIHDQEKDQNDEQDAEPEGEEEGGWVQAFHKCKEHTEIHVDDLHRALEHIGFVSPNQSWVKEVFLSISPQYNTVELDDFILFVRGYQHRQHEAYATAFAKCDDDGSGFVEASELADLLRGFGIEPMSHVLHEVINEVDEDGRGTLDLEEFKQLMDLILMREGFTKSEYEEFLGIYSRFDRHKVGEIATRELMGILNWLGFAMDAKRAHAVVEQVDVDGSGSISAREYLMCMRKVRETELQQTVIMMKESDEDGSGTVNKDEVMNVLKGLGYEPLDATVIQEAAREIGLQSEEMELSELWRLLLCYRKKEGFCKDDVAQMDKAFDLQDKDGSGELTALEASRALRELGFTASFEVMQSVLSKVDVDDTGELDKVEFRKMIRMLQERDIQTYREAFRAADQKGSKVLTEQKATEAIESLGYKVSRKYLTLVAKICSESPIAEGVLDLDAFVRACCRHARDVREVYRRNGGWSDREVLEMEEIFKRYDVKQAGAIANKELVKLVEDLFPGLAYDRAMRPQLQDMMKEVCSDQAGGLKFKEFLKLMQLFREFQDRERVQKEMNAIKGTGFSAPEVAEFRDFFLGADDSSGELCFDEFRDMIHMITPLGDSLTAELQKIFLEFTQKRGAGNEEADFPEFLWLMRHLLDINFANIKEKTKNVKGQK